MDSQIETAMRHEISVNRLAAHIVSDRVNPAFVNIAELTRRLLDEYSPDMTGRDYEALRKRTEKQLTKRLNQMWDESTKDLQEFAGYEADYQAKTLAGFADVTATAVSLTAIAKNYDLPLILTSGDTKTVGLWAEYVAGNVDATIKLVDSEIRAARAQGLTNSQVVTRLVGTKKRDYADGLLNSKSRKWAENLVRTGSSHYANAARDAAADSMKDEIEGKVFSNVFDNRTTAQCFTAETPVLAFGRVINIFRSQYSGETVTIRTASGKKLVGTPNHPVLTASGFLPMGELDPAKHIVYTPILDCASLVGDENISVESTIGQLFNSFNEPSISSIVTKNSSANDFYGDGYGGDQKVDIVTPNSELRYNLETIFDKTLGNKFFSRIPNWLPFKGFCHLFTHLVTGFPSIKAAQVTTGKPKIGIKERFGSTGLFKYFRWSASCIKHLNSFISIPDNERVSNSSWECFHDSVSLKQGSHSGGAAIVLGSNFSSGKPIPVLIDNIISVERKFAEHFVYTLETDNGAYIAGGIIVKNCLHYGQLAHNGKVYALDDPTAPRLPLHFNERSIYLFKIKGVDPFAGSKASVGGNKSKEAAEDFAKRDQALEAKRELRAEQRAAGQKTPTTPSKVTYKGKKDADLFKPGQIEANISPQKFMENQPQWFVESSLGKTRAKLFKEGGLPIEKFTDTMGRPLTLKQMRELDDYDAYFRKAGL